MPENVIHNEEYTYEDEGGTITVTPTPTTVSYQPSEEADIEQVVDSIILRKFTISIQDGMTFADIFVKGSEIFDETLSEGMTVQEIFTISFGETYEETPSDNLQVQELYELDFLPALRPVTNDQALLRELFNLTFIGVIRQNLESEAVLNEIFDLTALLIINQSVDSGANLHEDFSLTLLEIIARTASDGITVDEIFSLDYSQFQAPTNVDVSHIFGGSNVITWDYAGGDPDHFEMEVDVNFADNWSDVDNNISGAARSDTHDGCGSVYNNGASVRYRVRAISSIGGPSAWATSGSVNITNC